MSKIPSFEKINYLLRPSKQVERKMIIDLLSTLTLDISISQYQYIGMGSIYYYDFILMHKYFGIKRMTSIDNKSCKNRFLFNKPFDFVDFENCESTDYLFRHNFNDNSIFWLDYDSNLSGNESLKADIDLIGKNCIEGDLYFATVNCETPVKEVHKEDFLKEFSRYIPPELNHIKNVIPRFFPSLVQQIILNIIAESCEYKTNKFLKLCSFTYRDGALMYTIGGIFTEDTIGTRSRFANNKLFQLGKTDIYDIKIPNLTYKEKYYLDSNITSIDALIKYSKEYWGNQSFDSKTEEDNINNFLATELEFEISYKDLFNYIRNYRFVPQYYESMI